MADKIKSEIIRIDLTDASYKDSHAYIEPTYVNFFFVDICADWKPPFCPNCGARMTGGGER